MWGFAEDGRMFFADPAFYSQHGQHCDAGSAACHLKHFQVLAYCLLFICIIISTFWVDFDSCISSSDLMCWIEHNTMMQYSYIIVPTLAHLVAAFPTCATTCCKSSHQIPHTRIDQHKGGSKTSMYIYIYIYIIIIILSCLDSTSFVACLTGFVRIALESVPFDADIIGNLLVLPLPARPLLDWGQLHLAVSWLRHHRRSRVPSCVSDVIHFLSHH